MSCLNCEKRPSCKELCQTIKNILRSNNIYSHNWSRHKMPNKKRKGGKWREIPFSIFSRTDRDDDTNPYMGRTGGGLYMDSEYESERGVCGVPSDLEQ